MKQKKESELNKKELKEFKSKTWSYFISQKIKEIVWGLGILFCVTILPLIIGFLIGTGFCRDALVGESSFGCNTLFGYWETGAFIVIPSCFIGLLIYLWIKSNLTKAKERAKEELNIKQDYSWL